MEGKRAYMASSTFTFYYFSPRVTCPLCNFCFLFESHPLLSPGVEPEKGECANSTFAPGSSFSLDYCRCYYSFHLLQYCVSFFQLDSLASNFQLWMKTISLYSRRFKRKGRPYRSNKFLDASFYLHLRKLTFNLSSVTDLNSKPCTKNLFDKATVDSQFSAVKLKNKEHPRGRFLEVDRNFHEVIFSIAKKERIGQCLEDEESRGCSSREGKYWITREAVTWLRELVRAWKLCTFYLNNVMLNIVYYLNTFSIYKSDMLGGVIQYVTHDWSLSHITVNREG